MASRPLLHLGMPNAFSIFYYLFHDNFLSVWFCREFISLILMGKALGFFLPISIACIKWSQPFNTYFGQRCIPSGASPKRGLGWVPEINHFPPYNKLHPLQILWSWAYLICIGWVQVGSVLAKMWLSYCFLLFLLSFPCRSCCRRMALSCFSPALSLPVLIFYGKCHGLIGLCPTFTPSWARGFAYYYFLLGQPVGPYFFLFFVLGF